jgi:CBS domain-containing protein
MSTAETAIDIDVAELSETAIGAFCDDFGGMLDLSMDFAELDSGKEKIKGLRKKFSRLNTINFVKSEGVVNGSFAIVFDKIGLFALAGTMVMHPSKRILENIEKGTLEEGLRLSDAAKEIGNLLVGSWDRVFREELDSKGHMLHTGTSIAADWKALTENMSFEGDDCLLMMYEITVSEFPPFKCGVVFPENLFANETQTELPADESSDDEASQQADTDETANADKTGDKDDVADSDATADTDEGPSPSDASAETDKEKVVESDVTADTDEDADASESSTEEAESASSEEPEQPNTSEVSADKETADTNDTENVTEQKPPTDTDKPADTNESSEVEDVPNADETASQKKQDASSDNLDKPDKPEESADEDCIESTKTEKEDNSISDLHQCGEHAASENIASKISYTVCQTPSLSEITAEQIMNTRVVWISPKESVQDALRKMEQHDVSSLMVGIDKCLESTVSYTNISAAMSPYLRAPFERWRRPLDDATLRIRVKWIATRPVHTITPKTPAGVIMAKMSQFNTLSFPVVDEQGDVRGTVGVFDVFKTLLGDVKDISTAGVTQEVPAVN